MSEVIPARSKAAERPARQKAALVPQRSNGRERVAQILQAASEVIHQRGYADATMKEIAERADTNIGSLYRFFPTKEILADALLERYVESSAAQWKTVIAQAATTPTAQLGDLLLDAYAQMRGQHKALHSILESTTALSARRKVLRARNLVRIARTLGAHAPHLPPAQTRRIAVMMFYNMRIMNTLTFEPGAPRGPGAIDELRTSVRLYLQHRLAR